MAAADTTSMYGDLPADFLRAVLDHAAEGIAAIDADGRTVYANLVARQILGIPSDDGEVAPWNSTHATFWPDDPEQPFPDEERASERGLRGLPTDQLELFIRGSNIPDGIFVRMNGRPMYDADGAIIGVVICIRDATALRATRVEALRLAATDALTGLPNRRAFEAVLARHCEEGTHGRHFALVIVDVDDFKSVNDEHGHQFGDQVLIEVAAVLRRSVPATDFVARVGGDEFCVLLADVDEGEAWRVAEEIRANVTSNRGLVPLTASVGVASFVPATCDTSEALLAAADRALYEAKASGRDRVARAS